MANAKLGGYLFDVNPSSISWGYSLIKKKEENYGGNIVQILGMKIDNMTVSGQIRNGRGGQFSGMENFEREMRAIMDYHVSAHKPVQFSMPALGLSGNVYLTDYSTVDYAYDSVVATYTLKLAVDNGFSYIQSAAQNREIVSAFADIDKGVGMVSSTYRNPQTSNWDTVIQVMQELYDSGITSGQTFLDMFEAIKEGTSQSDENMNESSATLAESEAEQYNGITSRSDYSYLVSLGLGTSGASDMSFSDFLAGYYASGYAGSDTKHIEDVTSVNRISYSEKTGAYTVSFKTYYYSNVKETDVETSVLQSVLTLWNYYEYVNGGTSTGMVGSDADSVTQALKDAYGYVEVYDEHGFSSADVGSSWEVY